MLLMTMPKNMYMGHLFGLYMDHSGTLLTKYFTFMYRQLKSEITPSFIFKTTNIQNYMTD